MALVDVPGNGKSDSGAIEIILRAARLGLFTAAEARLLIDRIRQHTAALDHPAHGDRAGTPRLTEVCVFALPDQSGSVRISVLDLDHPWWRG
ncbi:hypothetical protein [Actinophytocola sp.]|uniref:hypothetical protein n=1 Tax=Actinophytocola sp. TaxID=1872138 RepID=UPI002D7E8B25|nr:hypothetical protein [Actinophytocola sp.]HET9140394.1 hypothetical protein [Actinophytocola sp.]HEU5108634.1 hypothetical protein [Micromonosporaceae bacterium]